MILFAIILVEYAIHIAIKIQVIQKNVFFFITHVSS